MSDEELRKQIYNNLPTCSGEGSINCTFKTPSVVCKRAITNILYLINQYVNKKVVENVKNEIRHIVEGDEDGVVYSLTAIGQRATLRLSKLNSLTSTGDKNE